MERIRTYFDTLISLSDDDWTIFSSKLIRRSFKKNATILESGKTEHFLSFVDKGTIRFWLEHLEKEITFAFAFENMFASAYDSFLTQEPANYHIQTLTETVLWSIHYRDLQEVYKTTVAGNHIGRLAAEDLFIKKTKREISLLKNTAEQRYLNLFSETPHFLEAIPLRYLASYIGITPQALSRIRKRIF